jgi:hypothetical protein
MGMYVIYLPTIESTRLFTKIRSFEDMFSDGGYCVQSQGLDIMPLAHYLSSPRCPSLLSGRALGAGFYFRYGVLKSRRIKDESSRMTPTPPGRAGEVPERQDGIYR